MLLPMILLCLVVVTNEVPRKAVSQTPERPNKLIILTDDQDRTSADQVYIDYLEMKGTEYYDLTEDPYQLDGTPMKPPPHLKRAR